MKKKYSKGGEGKWQLKEVRQADKSTNPSTGACTGNSANVG